MLETLFALCMLWIFGKLFFVGLRATWGLTKMLFTIILIPAILVGMVVGGLIYIAFPVLIIIGIMALFVSKL